jgi:signal transduction histidine kinase
MSAGVPGARTNAGSCERNAFSQVETTSGPDAVLRSVGRAADSLEDPSGRTRQLMTMSPPHDSYPQLLSLAVHELRTPASVVGGYLRMLQRDTDSCLNERQRKMIEEAEKSCARLVQLVGELSDVSKLDAGLVTIAQQPLDVFDLVEDVANGVHEESDRDVRLEVRGHSSGASITGDTDRLRTAFHSIFRAILREQPTAGVVVAERRLETSGDVTSAVIVVAESGRVHAAYSAPAGPFDEKRGGLGLALPIARRVIEAHGGHITSPSMPDGADSVAGRGVAIITLPLRS